MSRGKTVFLMAAALTSSRERRLPFDGVDVDAGALLQVLEENKVPLGWLGRNTVSKTHSFLASTEFVEAREKEQFRLTSQRSRYGEVMEAFGAVGVGGVLIKPVDLDPSFPITSDNLDLFIEPGRMAVARGILREKGLVEIRHVEERGKYLFRRFRGGEEALAIHLHEDVAWDGVVFVNRDSLWRRRRSSSTDDLVTLPSPEDSVLINLAHAFYENKQIKLSDLLKIEFCLDSYRVDWDYLSWMARKRGWLFGLTTCFSIANHLYRLLLGEDLLDGRSRQEIQSYLGRGLVMGPYVQRMISQPEPDLPYPIAFALSKAYWYAKMLGDRNIGWRDKSTDLFLTSLRGFQRKFQKEKRSQPSMLISLSGIDGCGKTAQAEALMRALTTAEVKTTYVWLRGSSSLTVRLAKDLLAPLVCVAKNELEPDQLPDKQRRARLISNPFLQAIYPYFTFLDLMWQYNKKVRIPLLQGRVVIADRYVYDAIADLGADFDNPQAHRLLASRLLCLISPKPSVAYLLDLPAEIGYQRKDDEPNLDELLARCELYRTMAGKDGLTLVNAARDFETVSDEIVHDALRRYCDNHWTLVNAMFQSNPSKLAVVGHAR